MWYADTVGLKKVRDRIREFHAKHGEFWEPAPLLVRLADQGETFADYDAAREQLSPLLTSKKSHDNLQRPFASYAVLPRQWSTEQPGWRAAWFVQNIRWVLILTS